MSGDDVCCNVVIGPLVGVFVFIVMWSELLMTSAISSPLWSSVYECQRVEYAFTSPMGTGVWYGRDVLYVVLYVRVRAWMFCLEEVYYYFGVFFKIPIQSIAFINSRI